MNRNELERQRQDILRQMGKIRTMRRGSVSEQFLKVTHKEEAQPVLRGPYYLWQYWINGKPVRKRLRTRQEVEAARHEVAAYKAFEGLCQAYVRTTEALGALDHQEADGQETLKKTRKSPPKQTRK